jgi:hypothetical protein
VRKDWKYIVYLTLVVGLFVLVKLSERKQADWTITFAPGDKEPYGTYAFNQLAPIAFSTIRFQNSYKTIYELKDSLSEKSSFISISTSLRVEKEDTEALFTFVEKGGTALISAHHFSGRFADTLGLSTRDNGFANANILLPADSSSLHFTNTHFDSTQLFNYRRDNIHYYFSRLDSIKGTVIFRNEQNQPVTIRIAKGKGQLILNCTPMAFTNIYLLYGENHQLISNTLSYLKGGDVWRTQYYHLGRMEAGTPLRFILTTEPLRWAYYLVVLALLFFILFEAKRKQRIIPVITPFSNSTLEFVSVIGNLYFQKGDHKNIAEKKIQFFLEKVRTQYFLTTTQRDENFTLQLARKSGNNEETTRGLVKIINEILSTEQISKEKLTALNQGLESFNKSKP